MGIKMPTLRSRPITLAYDIPINKTLKFYDGLKEGKIFATRCKKCKKVFFPPVADCADCLSTEMNWIELNGEANVEAFTHIIIKPSSFQHEKPYSVAVGRMKNEDVKVLAWLTDANLSDIKVNMKVKLVVKSNIDGEPTYMFEPI